MREIISNVSFTSYISDAFQLLKWSVYVYGRIQDTFNHLTKCL